MINLCSRFGRTRQIVKGVQGPSGGYQDVYTYPTIMVGTVVPALASATYDIDVQLDGEALDKMAIPLLITDTWDGIAAKIQTQLQAAGDGTETVVIQSNGAMRFTSAKTGLVSSVALAAGTTGSGGGDYFAAVDALVGYTSSLGASVVGTQGDIDKSGFATISNTGTLLTFGGAVVAGLASATYDLDITVDGGALRQTATALLITDTWDAIAGKIQVALRALTGSTETISVINGNIQVTSATGGAASAVLIAIGTAASGGGDILAAIDALGGTYLTSLDSPVAGTEGTIMINVGIPRDKLDSIAAVVEVRTSAGLQKTNTFTVVENNSTGYITITESGANTFTAGDVVTMQTWHYKAGTSIS